MGGTGFSQKEYREGQGEGETRPISCESCKSKKKLRREEVGTRVTKSHGSLRLQKRFTEVFEKEQWNKKRKGEERAGTARMNIRKAKEGLSTGCHT